MTMVPLPGKIVMHHVPCGRVGNVFNSWTLALYEPHEVASGRWGVCDCGRRTSVAWGGGGGKKLKCE